MVLLPDSPAPVKKKESIQFFSIFYKTKHLLYIIIMKPNWTLMKWNVFLSMQQNVKYFR